MMLSRHHPISSAPKQVPWTVVLLLLLPRSPCFKLDEATFLSAHCFGAFCVLQFPEDVRVLEPKLWALVQLCVNIGPLMVICCQELLFLPSSLLPLFLKNNVCINWVKKKNSILLNCPFPKLGFPDDFRQGMQTVICFSFLIK